MKNLMLRRFSVLTAAWLCVCTVVNAIDYRIDVATTLSWETYELQMRTTFDLASAGLKMPTGRNQAEIFATNEFPRLARNCLYGIQVNSSQTVENLISSGALSPAVVGEIAARSQKSAAVLSLDQSTLSTDYRIKLWDLAAQMIKHKRAEVIKPPLQPRPTRAYTGILIYANEPLPLAGTRTTTLAVPCFFPKIWDSSGNLVYEQHLTDPEVAKKQGIVRYGSSADGYAYESFLGREPLRVLATGLFGKVPTDIIISNDDAQKIISSPENCQLLRQGRIVIVLNKDALTR